MPILSVILLLIRLSFEDGEDDEDGEDVKGGEDGKDDEGGDDVEGGEVSNDDDVFIFVARLPIFVILSY